MMNMAATIGLQLGALALAALCVWGIHEIHTLRSHGESARSHRPKHRLSSSAVLTGLGGLGLAFVAFAVAQFAHYG